MSLGTLYERFLAQQEAERAYAADASAGSRNDGIRRWFAPDGNGWNGDPLDVEGTAVAFSRGEIAEAYQGFFFDAYGTVGDCIVAKVQSDYLACQERAYRSRHLTPIRAAAHSSARLRGHGDAESGTFSRLSSQLQDVLVEGSTGLPQGGYPQ